MKLLFLLSLLSIGCSSIVKKPSLTKGQCFVKWSSLEYKILYAKGEKLSRDEKSAKSLLFPLWQNQGIYIIDQFQKDLIVIFDPSDKTPFDIIEKMKSNIFFELSPETESSLRTSKFRFSEYQLQTMLNGYEQVNCAAYMDAQFL